MKKMYLFRKWGMVFLAISIIFAGQALAKGERMQAFLDGVLETVAGTVYEAAYIGQGLVIDTGTEQVTVYGIGPQKYWDGNGISRPDVGEEVIVDAVMVQFADGAERLIATSIAIEDETIDLRDENGKPLWRQGKRRAPKPE